MWTPELTKMWESRFEAITRPEMLFHDFIELCSESEALGDLKLAIEEIKRLQGEVKRLEDEIEWGGR
jgi:hypothetical protein